MVPDVGAPAKDGRRKTSVQDSSQSGDCSATQSIIAVWILGFVDRSTYEQLPTRRRVTGSSFLRAGPRCPLGYLTHLLGLDSELARLEHRAGHFTGNVGPSLQEGRIPDAHRTDARMRFR